MKKLLLFTALVLLAAALVSCAAKRPREAAVAEKESALLESDLQNEWSEDERYAYLNATMGCRTYKEYEEKVKKGEIVEPPADVQPRIYASASDSRFNRTIVLADGTTVGCDSSYKEILDILKSMQDVQIYEFMYSGRMPEYIVRLKGENEGFSLFICELVYGDPAIATKFGKMTPSFVVKLPTSRFESYFENYSAENEQNAWERLEHLANR